MANTIISVAELAKHLGDDDWRIVDCRFSLADTGKGRADYQLSHIPGAVYAHLDEDLSGTIIPAKTGRHPLPPVGDFEARLSAWGIRNNSQVVAYDDGPGMVASRLWWMMRWLGHDQVAVLDGGWKQWLADNQPVSKEAVKFQHSQFIASPREGWIVDSHGVERIREDTGYMLADSRALERFRGEVEPIDPVAGHIPGACSLPFGDNLDQNGLMKSPSVLRNRFIENLGSATEENTVFYCGSGVSACQNLLAYHHAGLGDARLYAGSWSEWITDPRRPVEPEAGQRVVCPGAAV